MISAHREAPKGASSLWVVKLYPEVNAPSIQLRLMDAPAAGTMAIVAVASGRATCLRLVSFTQGSDTACTVSVDEVPPGALSDVGRARIEALGVGEFGYPEGLLGVVGLGPWTEGELEDAAPARVRLPGPGVFPRGGVLKPGPRGSFLPRPPGEISLTTLGPDAFCDQAEVRIAAPEPAQAGIVVLTRAPERVHVTAFRDGAAIVAVPRSCVRIDDWHVCLLDTSRLIGEGETALQRDVEEDLFTQLREIEEVQPGGTITRQFPGSPELDGSGGAQPPPPVAVTVAATRDGRLVIQSVDRL
jgi:hypothetical protein